MPRGRTKGGRAGAFKTKERDPHDMLLLAFIFIGLGVGVAFNNPGPGLLMGTGIGVLLRGLSKYGSNPQQIAISLSVASYILALFGLYFIFLGLILLYGITFQTYGTSVLLLIVGFIMLVLFFRRKNARR